MRGGLSGILQTPAAVIDVARMSRNIHRMQKNADTLGVLFRPHAKTSKCIPVVRAQIAAGARGITVSTLKEADYFFTHGITDILYAVGIAPQRLPQVSALRRAGCDLKIITDNVQAAAAIASFGHERNEAFEVLIEIDADGDRAGVRPDDASLLAVARTLRDGGVSLGGVLTHAGSSYHCRDAAALANVASQERAAAVFAAERLRAADFLCPTVTVGSTPTALSAASLDGVTELRAGVYVFFDLVMANIGVCTVDDIALSVVATVIGHQVHNGWAIVDCGWTAMSRDRGTESQARDYGYGQICNLDGSMLPGYVLSAVNQEHGVVSRASQIDTDIAQRFPVGSRLRILPNHACATGAQFIEYRALAEDGTLAVWSRLHGC